MKERIIRRIIAYTLLGSILPIIVMIIGTIRHSAYSLFKLFLIGVGADFVAFVIAVILTLFLILIDD